MTVTMDTAVAELKLHKLADPEQRMKPHGRDLVIAEIDRWASRGLHAHALVTARGDAIDAAELFKRLGYVDATDFVLVFDGYNYRGHGWGQDVSGHAPENAKRTIADELIALVRAHGVQAVPKPPPKSAEQLPRPPAPAQPPTSAPVTQPPAKKDDSGFSMLPVVGGTLVVAVGGVVALAIMRRNKLAREGAGKVGDAMQSLERNAAELVLACEELPGDPQATDIQLKAAELKKRADVIVAETEAKPQSGNDPVTLGQLRQLENEIAALRSTVLQKTTKKEP
jgi:hypothetical protein